MEKVSTDKRDERREKFLERYWADAKEWGLLAEQQSRIVEPVDVIVSEVVFSRKWGKSKKAVDIGCGNGKNSVFLAKQGFDVLAVDKSKQALEIVDRKAKREQIDNLHTLLGDIGKIPVPDGYFDLAVSHMILDLYRMPSRRRYIREIERMLKPGGVAIIASEFREDEVEKLKGELGNFKIISEGHDRFFSYAKGAKLLSGETGPYSYWTIVAEKKADSVKDCIKTRA
jgi:SAM-dependent methyltransferase